jgi:hypothetical protein
MDLMYHVKGFAVLGQEGLGPRGLSGAGRNDEHRSVVLQVTHKGTGDGSVFGIAEVKSIQHALPCPLMGCQQKDGPPD